jgi:predicted transcriptional regulator
MKTDLTTLRDEMRAVARGEARPSPKPAASLLAALSSEALDLLGVLWRERPSTVASLVALTGRAQPNVSRSLQQLAAHGLLRLVREGREVRPDPIVRTLTIDLSTGAYQAEEMDAATAGA